MSSPRPAKTMRRARELHADPPLEPLPTGDWLRPLGGPWTRAAAQYLEVHPRVARVTVTALRGSGPREAGATMLVDTTTTRGTIGGGHLEHHAVSLARALLVDAQSTPARIVELVLGPELGQCCGGRVELWLERLTRMDRPWLRDASGTARGAATSGRLIASQLSHDAPGSRVIHRIIPASPRSARIELKRGLKTTTLLERLDAAPSPLWVFGAGHVGQALVRVLAPLECFDITWIDSRADVLPADAPGYVTVRAAASPAALVETAPPGTRFVVLTHDHALDFEVCRRILARGDAAWLGLIGSASKAARFRSRLLRDGVAPHEAAGLTCPIGVPGVASKHPAAIAIAVAAQLLLRAAAIPAAQPGHASDCADDCGSCGVRRERPA